MSVVLVHVQDLVVVLNERGKEATSEGLAELLAKVTRFSALPPHWNTLSLLPNHTELMRRMCNPARRVPSLPLLCVLPRTGWR